jgi:NAD(P) transhydrogenase
MSTFHSVSAYFGTFIGGMTLTGSIAAYIKLAAILRDKNLDLPFKNMLNRPLMGLSLASLGVLSCTQSPALGVSMLLLASLTSTTLGWNITFNIGAADMPVAITVLNSYSGWALCAEGFMLNNTLLTIVGSLVGSSGAILSYIMCRAMNRDLTNVIFGSMGDQGTGTVI